MAAPQFGQLRVSAFIESNGREVAVDDLVGLDRRTIFENGYERAEEADGKVDVFDALVRRDQDE